VPNGGTALTKGGSSLTQTALISSSIAKAKITEDFQVERGLKDGFDWCANETDNPAANRKSRLSKPIPLPPELKMARGEGSGKVWTIKTEGSY